MIGPQGGSGPGWYYKGKHYDAPQLLHEAMNAEIQRLELQNRDLQQLFSEVATMFELPTRHDIDGLLRARIQEALAGVPVALKPKGEPECDCLVPAMEGAGQHSPSCAIFKRIPARAPCGNKDGNCAYYPPCSDHS